MLLTLNQACEALNIKRSKMYDLLNTGQLKGVRLGKRTMFKTDELKTFIDSLPAGGHAKRKG